MTTLRIIVVIAVVLATGILVGATTGRYNRDKVLDYLAERLVVSDDGDTLFIQPGKELIIVRPERDTTCPPSIITVINNGQGCKNWDPMCLRFYVGNPGYGLEISGSTEDSL
jgi:hypothetical protein